MFWRWRRQMRCTHPDEYWHAQLLNIGQDKMFWCTRCKFVTYASQRHQYFFEKRWCRHLIVREVDLPGRGTVYFCAACMTEGVR